VIVFDANVLLYAYSPAFPEHDRARKCLEDAFSGNELVGLPWQTISAFIRILTHPGFPGVRRPVKGLNQAVFFTRPTAISHAFPDSAGKIRSSDLLCYHPLRNIFRKDLRKRVDLAVVCSTFQ
jgi:predicted nucleic acid-binding protein